MVAQAGINAVHASLPRLRAGASIIATGSTAAYPQTLPYQKAATDSGGIACMVAKRMLSSYMHDLARELAPREIRANVVHHAKVNPEMLQSEVMYRSFRPDLDHPTREDATPGNTAAASPSKIMADLIGGGAACSRSTSRHITGADTIYWGSDYPHAEGTFPGKGEALWKSLLVSKGDLLVFIDADLTHWGPHFVTGLLGPLLEDPRVALVKGFYERLFDGGTARSPPTAGG